MVYRIAICDDESITCIETERMCRRIFEEFAREVEIDCFFSGEELLEQLHEKQEFYHFLLLDIELIKQNGVEVGKHLRDVLGDYKIQIIYFSSKTNYAMELFQVQPLDFLVKPLKEGQLRETFEKGFRILGVTGECFEIATGHRKLRIPYDQILFLESEKRMVRLVTRTGEERFYEKLSSIMEMLPKCFIQIHKSFVINMNHVRLCEYERVTMNNGEVINISRSYQDATRKKFMDRRFH